jgi:hypothetical protein
MLVAAALLLAIAGTGAFGSGTSRSSDEGTGLQGTPPAAQQGGQSFMHHGRHCHHGQGGQQAPQQDPTGSPPV